MPTPTREVIIEGTNITFRAGVNRLCDVISSKNTKDADAIAAFELLLKIRGDLNQTPPTTERSLYTDDNPQPDGAASTEA